MESEPTCRCLKGHVYYRDFDQKDLGIDRNFGEISIQRCKQCGRLWLHYFYEHEAFSKSGRWFRGLISPEAAESLKPEDAISFLEKLDWYFCGGSYFGAGVHKSKGRIHLWP